MWQSVFFAFWAASAMTFVLLNNSVKCDTNHADTNHVALSKNAKTHDNVTHARKNPILRLLNGTFRKSYRKGSSENATDGIQKQNKSSEDSFQVNTRKSMHFLRKIHATVTQSKDAVWATMTLTFMCVLLLIAVAHSRMWKEYRGSEAQGVPLPKFNERVLFRDVMEQKTNSLKEFFQKKKKNISELESLLPLSEWE